MISRYNKTICTLILPLFLTGCWDYKDINDRSISITAGLDVINDEIELSVEKARIWEASLGKSSMAHITETYKVNGLGRTAEEARVDYETQIPAPVFSGANRAIVISKRYAEKKEIESYINRLYFLSAFRGSALVAVSQESIDELFSKKIENDISVGYGIEDTVRYLDESGRSLYKTIQEIQSDIQFGNIGYLLPYVTNKNNTIKYLGLAAMKESRLVGIVKFEESNGFLLVLSKKSVDTRSIPNPSDDKKLLFIRSKLSKRSIKTSFEDDKINIYIDLKLKSQVQYESIIKPLSNEDIKKVEEGIVRKIKDDILSAAKRSQKEFKSDVFGFARNFKAENPHIFKNINWIEEYPKAIFHVNVKTIVENTNLLDPNAKKAD